MTWYGTGTGGTGGLTALQVQGIIEAKPNAVIVKRADSVRVGAAPIAADWPHTTVTLDDAILYQYANGSSDLFTSTTPPNWDAPRFTPAPGGVSAVATPATDPTGLAPAPAERLAVLGETLYLVDDVTGLWKPLVFSATGAESRDIAVAGPAPAEGVLPTAALAPYTANDPGDGVRIGFDDFSVLYTTDSGDHADFRELDRIAKTPEMSVARFTATATDAPIPANVETPTLAEAAALATAASATPGSIFEYTTAYPTTLSYDVLSNGDLVRRTPAIVNYRGANLAAVPDGNTFTAGTQFRYFNEATKRLTWYEVQGDGSLEVISATSEGDAGDAFRVTTADLIAVDAAAFINTPTLAQFRAILANDLLLPTPLYTKGDTLYYEAPETGFLFMADVTADGVTDTLQILSMREEIPQGAELVALPGNRATFRESYLIVVNSIDYKMQSGAWTRVTPPGGSSSVTVIPLTFNAGGIAKAGVPAALEAAHPAATDGIYAKRRVTNIDPSSVPNLEIVSPVFQALMRSDGTNASLEWVEVV